MSEQSEEYLEIERFIKDKYGIQEYNNYQGTQTIELMDDYAKLYHKQQVESITEETVKRTAPKLCKGNAHESSFGYVRSEVKGFIKGANWFKNHLLKQKL